MSLRRASLGWLTAILALAGAAPSTEAHVAKAESRLPTIGPAPDFRLTATDGQPLGLGDLRGQAVVLTFLYATCVDTCPLLTAKLVGIQRALEHADAGRVRFVAITVDPDRDTPEVLRRYAAAHRAMPPAWVFLTGPSTEIHAVTTRYGVYAHKRTGGDVDHTFLTSIIDGTGVLRVQYLGVRFAPAEFLEDLRSVLHEGRPGPSRPPP